MNEAKINQKYCNSCSKYCLWIKHKKISPFRYSLDVIDN